MGNLIYKNEVYAIIGACMEVHNELKSGFLEPIYQEALAREFDLRKIPYEREKPLVVFYKNQPLKKQYIADFVCYDKIILELKSVGKIISEHEAQLLNYLNITHHKLGVLVNFVEKTLKYKRLIL